MCLVLIKLDVLIIRWIRFDRILFSDIIIPRIPWSASSFGHVYNGLGHFSGRFVCDRLQNMYWISFLPIYFCWSTCMHIQQMPHAEPYLCHLLIRGRNTWVFCIVTPKIRRFSKWVLSLLNLFKFSIFFRFHKSSEYWYQNLR